MTPDEPTSPDEPSPHGEPSTDALAAAAAAQQAERRAAFMAAHGDIGFTPPLAVALVALLAWWGYLGWQATHWWPALGRDSLVVTGVAHAEQDTRGALVAIVVGEGSDAPRFACKDTGWQLRVLHVPVMRCVDEQWLLKAADGREVRVAYDRPSAGGEVFNRLLAMRIGGEHAWRVDDSVAEFGWQLRRAAFAGLLLLWPGWILHRRWPRAD